VGLLAVILVFGSMGFIIAYASVPSPGHGGNGVFVRVGGDDLNLQAAINSGKFNAKFVGSGSSSRSIIHGHSGDDVVVNVNGNVKSFQAAINDGSLCAAAPGSSPSSFGAIVGKSQTGDEIIITNSSGAEKTLQAAINGGEFYKCPPGPSGYSLVYLGRQLSTSYVAPWSWVAAIDKNEVVDTSNLAIDYTANTNSDLSITYSTSEGDWKPVNTRTDDLRLSVSANNKLYNYGKGPTPMLRVIYRVWGDTAVSVKTHVKADGTGTFSSKIDRTDVFQRKDKTKISVRGDVKTIALESFLDIKTDSWNPADHGYGNAYLRVKNRAENYFDIEIFVQEQDEQSDTSRVWIDSYIEAA